MALLILAQGNLGFLHTHNDDFPAINVSPIKSVINSNVTNLLQMSQRGGYKIKYQRT